MTNQKVAVFTGSSSGIGYETALALARNGFRTFATMRNLDKARKLRHEFTYDSADLVSSTQAKTLVENAEIFIDKTQEILKMQK